MGANCACCMSRDGEADGPLGTPMFPAYDHRSARGRGGPTLLGAKSGKHPSEGYEITDGIVGSGGFGDVRRVRSKRTGATCALKSVSSSKAGDPLGLGVSQGGSFRVVGPRVRPLLGGRPQTYSSRQGWREGVGQEVSGEGGLARHFLRLPAPLPLGDASPLAARCPSAPASAACVRRRGGWASCPAQIPWVSRASRRTCAGWGGPWQNTSFNRILCPPGLAAKFRGFR